MKESSEPLNVKNFAVIHNSFSRNIVYPFVYFVSIFFPPTYDELISLRGLRTREIHLFPFLSLTVIAKRKKKKKKKKSDVEMENK